MKITFGMIVFNGASVMPNGMLAACVRSVYGVAHQIIIVEGAVVAAQAMSSNGSSTDDTLHVLRSLDDPRGIIEVIPATGVWSSKTEMCNAWSFRATGDYVWQLDADEFYLEEDMTRVMKLLSDRKPGTLHFYADHFWGDWHHCVVGSGWANRIPWRRIFRHTPGSRWRSHAPPVYLNNGKSPQPTITRDETNAIGIRLKHYGYVARSQAVFKDAVYSQSMYVRLWEAWQQDHNISLVRGDRTEPYRGEHPRLIQEIM